MRGKRKARLKEIAPTTRIRRGKFITFEGGDGCGKSTQIRFACDFFADAGHEVLMTREPGGTKIGEEIRAILLNPAHGEMADMTEALLYAAARAQLAREVIAPALEMGKFVICDRWADSSIVYQGAARGLGKAVYEINAHAAGDLFLPDMTILLDLEPEKALARAAEASGGGHDRMEALGLSYHKKVREAYLELAAGAPQRARVVDASGSREDVFARVRDALADFLEDAADGADGGAVPC